MNCQQLLDKIVSQADWVNPSDTVDRILFGPRG